MRTNYVLVDFENVQPKDLGLLKDGTFKVKVFLGPNQSKIPVTVASALQALGDNAEYIVVGLGSLTYQLHDVVDTLRAEGHKIGVLGVRIYRPFPDEAIAAAVRHARGVFVIEKALSYGYEGALCSDLKAALYGRAGAAASRLPPPRRRPGGWRARALPRSRSGAHRSRWSRSR